MVIGELIEKSNNILKKAGISGYNLDTHVLLCKYLSVDRLYLLLNKDVKIKNSGEFLDMVKRRAAYEPVAYITGVKEFMSLEFNVTPNVLIPRIETEILVENLIEYIGDSHLSMLEIGTGSGCISISCAHYCKNLSVEGIDISQKAIDVAKQNAKKNRVKGINFMQMDILHSTPKRQYDIVVSNPPYIKSSDIGGLMKDVKDYEPIIALDGGVDGLLFYSVISKKAPAKKMIAFEVGEGQGDAVCSFLLENGYVNTKKVKDLSGIERVVLGFGKI
ncbi:MAG: peptide chain release factor N(5)-glutamine methyltransferase [Firmicutes bacterium]|nr:peptide chain release factor N(5)-glutamine methyltransferase [Bacillota bacterium]